MRQDLIGRFRQLWILELLNALIIFPALVLLITRASGPGPFAILGTASVSVMLVIGAAFNFLKYQDLRQRKQSLGKFEGLFRQLRRLIPVGFGIVLLYAITQLPSSLSGPQVLDLLLGLLLFSFAVLEYINYFHTQLMYDNRRDLKYLLTMKKLKRGLIAREFGWQAGHADQKITAQDA